MKQEQGEKKEERDGKRKNGKGEGDGGDSYRKRRMAMEGLNSRGLKWQVGTVMSWWVKPATVVFTGHQQSSRGLTYSTRDSGRVNVPGPAGLGPLSA